MTSLSRNPNCKQRRNGRIEVATKEVPMPDATKKAKEVTALHAIEPILSKKTDLFGKVDVFPPNAEPSQWSILSFLLVSDHSPDDGPGLKLHIKAKYIWECFERPHFIADHHKFGHADKKGLTD